MRIKGGNLLDDFPKKCWTILIILAVTAHLGKKQENANSFDSCFSFCRMKKSKKLMVRNHTNFETGEKFCTIESHGSASSHPAWGRTDPVFPDHVQRTVGPVSWSTLYEMRAAEFLVPLSLSQRLVPGFFQQLHQSSVIKWGGKKWHLTKCKFKTRIVLSCWDAYPRGPCIIIRGMLFDHEV